MVLARSIGFVSRCLIIGAIGLLFLFVQVGAAQPPSLSELTETLTSANAELSEQMTALEDLRRMESEAREAVPALIALVEDPQTAPEVRRRAIPVIEAVGLTNPSQARRLFALLEDTETDPELRRSLLMTFGDETEQSARLTPVLARILTNSEEDPLLRRQAVFALDNLEGQQPEVTTAFLDLAEDSSAPPELRRMALNALRDLESPSARCISVLVEIGSNPAAPDPIRLEALHVLRQFGPQAASAVDALVRLVTGSETETDLRRTALQALQQIRVSDPTAVGALLDWATGPDATPALRSALGPVLGDFPEEIARDHVPQLIELLQGGDHEEPIRRWAARTLSRVGLAARPALPAFLEIIQDKQEPAAVREAVTVAIKNLGEEARPAVDALLAMLRDPTASSTSRSAAAGAVSRIAQRLLEEPDQLARQELNQRIDRLRQMTNTIHQADLPDTELEQRRREIERVLAVLQTEKQGRWGERLLDWESEHRLTENRWVQAGGLVLLLVLALTGCWRFQLWSDPYRLWQLNERLRRFDWHAPQWLGGWRIGLRDFLLLSLWHYHRRVLDAWIGRHLSQVRSNLEKGSLSLSGSSHVPSPVVLNDEYVERPEWGRMQTIFQTGRVWGVIHGGRGTGKTNLAFQLIRQGLADEPMHRLLPHPVLPIFIGVETASQLRGSTKVHTPDVLKRGLRELMGESVQLGREALRRLLKRRRILLVADGFSEWEEAVQTAFLNLLQTTRVPLLILTTRHRPETVAYSTDSIETLPLGGGSSFSRFLEDYFLALGKRDEFSDTELFESSRNLSWITGGRLLTAEVIRLYGDFILNQKEGTEPPTRPQSLADVFGALLHQSNAKIQGKKPGNRTLRRITRQLAWLCVKERFSAGSVKLIDVYGQFAKEEDLGRKLDYLERQLGFVRLTGREQERLQFIHASLAEYLAAAHVVERNGNQKEAWQAFFKEADNHPAGRRQPFLQAVADSCYNAEDNSERVELPEFVRSELDKRLSEDELPKDDRLQYRVQSLLKQLLTPDPAERSDIIESLKRLGPSARTALPRLLETFRNPREDLEVRYSAIEALEVMGEAAQSIIPSLVEAVQDPKEHLFFRIKTLSVLVELGRGRPEIVTALGDILRNSDEPPFFRVKTVQALAEMKEQRRMIEQVLDDLLARELPEELRHAVRETRQSLPGASGKKNHIASRN